MATIIDVARAAGVSKSTVSRGFTNPAAVKAPTLEKINHAAQKLNYTPNALARAMITKKTETFGFIINAEQSPVISNPFYGQILEKVVELTGKRGYSLYISSSTAASEAVAGVVAAAEAAAEEAPDFSCHLLLRKQVDGVIFASYTKPELLKSFLERQIPVVLVNSRTDLPGVCCVISDDTGGIGQTVDYLVKKGHRSIGIIEGRFTRFIVDRRHRAFLRALGKNGLKAKESSMALTAADIHAAAETAYVLLGGKKPPSALVCTNDLIALGAIKAARRRGLHVPRDIAITGYDNSSLCIASDPAITSVDASTAGMGAAAVDFLFAQMEGKKIPGTLRTVKTRLVVRESA